MTTRSVVVIGGGIAGLSAAFEITQANADIHVTLFEAASDVGGALQTEEIDGRIIDLGADGFLATRPEALDLIRDVGCADDLVPIGASGAWIYLRQGLEPLPTGLVLGVPTRWSQIRQLRGLSGRARRGFLRDRYVPRRLRVGDDTSIGEILRTKFGSALVDELIEPMIGGIQAGRVDDLSAATVFPALYAAAQRGGSLQRAIRPTPVAGATPPGTIFYSLRDGLGSLPQRLATVVRTRGVDIRTHQEVTGIVRGTTRRWAVVTATTTTEADAIIVTTPASNAGRLLAPLGPALADLATIPTASTAMVTFVVNRDAVPLPATGTGFLVPLQTPFRDNESMIITAATLLDRKWPYLAHDETVVVRVHAGRSDDSRAAELSDDDLVERVREELAIVLGTWPPAHDVVVQRWPAALPQYLVGHADRVRIARQVTEEQGIWLAGMTYDGVGVPATIGSGRRAGRTVAATFS